MNSLHTPSLLHRVLILAGSIATLLANQSAHAATFNWQNTGTDWNTAGNWSAATVPGTTPASDIAVSMSFQPASINPTSARAFRFRE